MRDREEIFMFGFRGFPAVQGGIETHVENLAPRLVASGHRVTACLRSPYVGAECGASWKGVRLIRVWTVRNAWLEALLHSLICALVAGLRRPAVVHIHGIGPALVTPLVRLLGLRVVVTHHGPDYDREKWGAFARTALRIGEAAGTYFAHRQIAVSRTVQKLIVVKYGKSCEVIPNGVVLPDLPSQADRVRELGLEPGRYVLTVGRLVPEKRQLDLLHAFTLARPPGWKLAIVGRIDHENEYAKRIEAHAGTAQDVVIAGFRNGEELRQLYAHSGLFVLPSSHEGLPIALLEALSYGLPVLVSDIPANLEVVGDPARVFRMGNVRELAAKMAAATADRAPAGDREALRRDAVRRYDWDDVALRTAEVYAEVARERRGGAAVRRPQPAVGGRWTGPRYIDSVGETDPALLHGRKKGRRAA